MGHIPSGESKELQILTFEEARKKSGKNKSYDTNNWIYYPDFYSEYRYILGTTGKKTLITIGINPSTAEPEHLDNTLKTVERIALRNGFDSFIMFNVYAQRATKPNHMDSTFNDKLHNENMKAFRWMLEQMKGQPNIWAAWGTNIERRSYLKSCLENMIAIAKEFNARWIKIGKLSKAGHPHHPLYLPKDSTFETFEISKYIEET